ncbi:hypothetical protein E9104_22450, partial [Salmonella enterica subsp. enterica serovar Goldcoast]|uniref:recombinase family protein n=1 Tax=Salmonella enterica TaxID=28901 RepID=UPI001170DA44
MAADRTMTLDQAKADLLMRVYLMADEEHIGADRIAKVLNAEKVPVWQAREKRRATCWTRTRITKMLSDRSAVGEFQPTRDGKPNGPVWIGHVPQAIPHDLWNRVNAAAQSRKAASVTNRDTKVSNLFATLLKCECCGGNLTYQRGRASGTKITTKAGKTYT